LGENEAFLLLGFPVLSSSIECFDNGKAILASGREEENAISFLGVKLFAGTIVVLVDKGTVVKVNPRANVEVNNVIANSLAEGSINFN
jgi:hypothetical protein